MKEIKFYFSFRKESYDLVINLTEGDRGAIVSWFSKAPIRIGYTVSKKVGCAVVRNKIKRRLRAAANNVLATKKFAGNDYVFIGRKEAQYRKFNSLVSDINWAIKRLNKSEEI